MSDIEAAIASELSKLDAIPTLAISDKKATLNSSVKITKPGKKLSQEEYQARLDAIAKAPLQHNAGRYHNTKLTLAEKAARYEGDKLPPMAHIKMATVARLAKLSEDEAELRHRITEYYRLERHNRDAMLSHRELQTMLRQFHNHNYTYNTLRKQ